MGAGATGAGAMGDLGSMLGGGQQGGGMLGSPIAEAVMGGIAAMAMQRMTSLC